MNKFVKLCLISAMAVLVALMLFGYTKAVYGNYFLNSPFNGILMTLGLILAVYGAIKGAKYVWTLSLLVLIVTVQGCNYAKSNQQVVVSDDCGMTWKKINPGEAVPKGAMNVCYMKVVMPNYPMQGDSRFITNLKDKVRATVHIDYDYSIMDPLAFIKQAKYLGKANADADSDGALNGTAFEGAENMVIDKNIREIAKAMFLVEDIVELDQAELENNLLSAVNKALESFGVQLNFITLTFDLDEQTRQAIDVSTAMKVYESKGLSEVGKQVMIQRAGAPKIIIESKTEATRTE